MALGLAGIGILALVVMLDVAADVNPAAERAKLQIEAIKYGLGSIAAGGAAAALLLAVRRQRHAEQVHEHTVDDAAERRVTDLYTKAAEQLGHADAAVRLAGLYALERVAQSNPKQRQTIVNVLCAYLRMPYTAPADAKADTASGSTPLTALPMPSGQPLPTDARNPHQELQVRLTAQRILSAHLCLPDDVEPRQAPSITPSPHERFWLDVDLDLTGATLISWDLRRGNVRNVSFDSVSFLGDAGFGETTFNGEALFHGATFNGDALFHGVTFNGEASFSGATFSGIAGFSGATFRGIAGFLRVTFNSVVGFREATFSGGAWFPEATFSDNAWFSRVTFSGDAGFSRATFSGDATFSGATFSDDAGFDGATFSGIALFPAATFSRDAAFDGATFSGVARFGEATFSGVAKFGEATFSGGAAFHNAAFNGTAWFGEATFSGVAGFDGATFSGDARFPGATFSGDARFLGAAFIGDARFPGATFGRPPLLEHVSVTLRDDREDAWPRGWRLAPGASTGRLMREELAIDTIEVPPRTSVEEGG
ncbi:pentapeptide repeat-containing protein [Micromonospora ureilytica]|uniref:pentapeptide repeat-containing protein n=1 Tax=Micromonospora ureilytica TaxID=709868 RepID=UPI002E154F64|nr:pentapeptide repeat-containing protein [Micromonospora ureilytica]